MATDEEKVRPFASPQPGRPSASPLRTSPGTTAVHQPPHNDPPADLYALTQRERLSKAMGAAFLSHQVAQLERSVDSITFSRDSRLYDPDSGGGRSGRGRGGSAGRGGKAGSGNGRGGGKRETRVVDASALVHALPVLKRWVREDAYQLVVPLQGSPRCLRARRVRRDDG
jgi:hypothetical protein